MPINKRYYAPLIIVLFVGDILCLALSLVVSSWLTAKLSGVAFVWPSDVMHHWGYFAAFVAAWPITGSNNRLYISRRRDDLLSLLFDIVRAVALALIFAGFVVSFYTPSGVDPAFLSWFGVGGLFFITLFRVGLQLVLWGARSRGWNERQVLLIGVNARTKELIEAIHHHPQYGYRLVGMLEDEPSRCRIVEEFNLPYLGKFDSLEQVLTKHVIDEVYICLPVRSRYETIQNMAYLCEDSGVSVRMIADLFPLRLATSRFHKIDSIPILALSTVPEHQFQLILQRATDIVVALAALLILSPIFIGTAIAIRLDTPGPIFFAQERIGLNRRKFRMIKFRSMVANAEALRKDVEQLNVVEGGPMFKAKSDPRVTRVGRFIRKYSIDELPQIFNVLIGHMSLVGPRPALPKEVNQYSWTQHRRLSVKPGMTGLSQVRGSSDLSFKETLDLDLTYIDQWSLGLVFRILLSTIPAILGDAGRIEVTAATEGRRTFVAWVTAVVSVLGARSFAAAAAFLGNAIVARHLDVAGFGHFYVLFSLMTIVAGVTGPAIDTTLVRCAVKHITPDSDRSGPYFTAVFYFKVALSILTVLVGWFFGDTLMQWLVPQGKSPYAIGQRSITLAFIGGAVVSLWGLSQSYFQSHQRFNLFSGYEFCSSLLRLGMVFGLVALHVMYVPAYMIAYVIAPFTMAVISWTQLPRSVFQSPVHREAVNELFQFGLGIFVATVCTTLTQRLDIILLKTSNIAPEILGRYSAAVAIGLAGELVLLTFYSVLLPKAAAMKTAGELRRFIGQFRLPSLVFCLAMCAAIPFSGLFCRIVLGPKYDGTADYFSILLIGVIVSLACAPTVTALYSLGYAWLSASFEGLRLALTLVFGFIAMRHQSAMEMAFAMAGVRAGVSALSYVVAHQTVKFRMIRDDARALPPLEPASGI